MTFDPAKISHKLVELGEDWADKNAAAELLEESKKTLLADMMHRIMNQEGASKAAAEVKAMASTDYYEHVEIMTNARKEANKAKVRYDSAKTWASLEQTRQSNLRTEMKHLGG